MAPKAATPIAPAAGVRPAVGPGTEVEYRLTTAGDAGARGFGIDVDELRARRRPLVRYCTDWSEQQHHLAGALGAALAGQLLERGWIERAANSRAVRIIDAGHAALPDLLGVQTCSPRCAP